MNYIVNRNGQNLGTFDLAEVRRRRETREFTGEELVWAEGMSQWTPIDSVLLAQPTTPPRAVPPPIPKSALKGKTNYVAIWSIVAAAIFFAGLVTFTAIKVVKFVRIAQKQMGSVGESQGVQAVSKPIAWNSNSLTVAALEPMRKAFRVRQYLDGYRNNGNRDQRWDTNAVKFIQAWIEHNFPDSGATNSPSPDELGDLLGKEGACDDPLVLTVAAVTSSELHEKARRLRRAVRNYKESKHKAYPRLYATVELAGQSSAATGRNDLDRDAVELFRQAFRDGSFLPADEPEIAEILINDWGRNFFERNSIALCLSLPEGKDFAWLRLVLAGEQHVRTGWQARGNGYADTVTQQGWKTFADEMAKGREAFEKAWKLHPERGLPAGLMVYVAMGEGGAEEMRLWFDRATQAQIDQPQAWHNMRWGLRPRWHGSHQALISLGTAAVNTRRFDTDVPRKFFDCITDVESEMDLERGEHIYGRDDIWPSLQQMYEGYVGAQSSESARNAWRSTYAAVAYLAGKDQTARKQLEALNWNPVRLTGWGKDMSLMPLEVSARTGPQGRKAKQAQEKYEAGELTEAARLYNEINAAGESDARTRELATARLAAVKNEQRLKKGEWIDFMPADENDPDWTTVWGKFTKLADGAIEVTSGKEGHLFYSRTRVGADFEIKGEFEVVRSSTKAFQAGVVMGLPDSFNSEWYGFRMKRNATEREVASFAWTWSGTQVSRRVDLNDDRNTFEFRFHDGKGDASVNGKQVLHNARPWKNMRIGDDCLAGLGAFSDANETVIRYRNIKLRRLDQVSATPKSTAETNR